jgi:hypothetical protein
MKKSVFIFLFFCAVLTQAQTITDPLITSWKLNTTGHTVTPPSGTPFLTDVEAVYYDNSYVYVKTSGVPSYYSFNNPNINDASNGNFKWKITRTPQPASNPPSALGGGQYGVFIDGDPIFNAEDARSYQNAGIWHQLAFYFEYADFDNSWGHSTPTNVYHHHVINLALIDTSVKNAHSPLLGYIFDGNPIYGPFGYSDPNDTNSGVTRMTPSYQLGTNPNRQTYADGTALQPSQYGPAFTGQTVRGCYREDYIYVAGSGTLDAHNGRFCKTPEYPNGTYAYFCTMDSNNRPLYPFTYGQTLYGNMTPGNQGPTGGQNNIPANATLYVPITTAIGDDGHGRMVVFPNPTQNVLLIKTTVAGFTYAIYDIAGKELVKGVSSTDNVMVDVWGLNNGTYILQLVDSEGKLTATSRFVKL